MFMCEFDVFRIKSNINRCHKAAKILLYLSACLVIVDLLLFLPKTIDFSEYLFLLISHLIIIFIIPFWNWCYKKAFSKKGNIITFKLLYFTFILLLFIWGISVSLIMLFITKQISIYIMVTMGLSATIHLNKHESLAILILSSLVFILCVTLLIPEPEILYNHLIIIICTNIIAYITFTLNYNFSKSYFEKNTELQNSKYALEEINKELQRYDKNRTKLFTNISHELKTPINVIYGAHQLLDVQFNSGSLDTEKCKNYNSMIKQNSFRLIRLINNILDISKIDDTVYEIKKENLDIVESVENIVSSVSEFIKEKELSIVFDTDVEENVIAFDPDKLERIILNLISNAIKFTDCGGTIFVTIDTTPKDVYISVKDTGIGIDEDHQKVIFNRFAQIDASLSRNSEGTGIGLALVKSLMLLHGGDVTLKSSPGNGSDFTLRFPNTKLDFGDSYNERSEYKKKAYKNKIERIEIEFSDIYK
ncbi:sensor histidine kinase [Clostridium culturomicium]|uniref:sensor histidine kinase n=1 Tax=Clostridium culturomicium TaxID=1499683 RepID=UPI000694E35D|nr:HAMP domain-containing sensor histidine kinase [Clostridium culturomicium]